MKSRRQVVTADLLDPEPEVERAKEHKSPKRNWWQWDKGGGKNKRNC